MKKENIEIKKVHLNELLKECDGSIVPYYQRNYDWGKDEIDRLIYDIMNNETDEYFCGNIVIHTYLGKKTIVDGQQRISTFLLFVKTFLDWQDGSNFDFYDVTKYYINSQNLKDKNVLQKILRSKNIEKDKIEFQNSKYYQNIKSIGHILKDYLNDEKLLFKFKKRFSKLTLSLIIIGDDYDEYRLFTNINSTGLQLNAFDLCKNLILSKLDLTNDEIDKKLNQLKAIIDYLETNESGKLLTSNQRAKNLNDFVRLFIACEQGELENLNSGMLFRSFEKLYKSKFSNNMSLMYSKFIKFGHYLKFVKNDKIKNYSFNKSFRMINLQFETWLVLIMDILQKHSNYNEYDFNIKISKEQEEEINEAFIVVEYYILSRALDGKGSNVITRFVPSIIKHIDESKSYAANLINILYFERTEDNDKTTMVPKERFFRLLAHSNIYDKTRYCKNLLIRINEIMDKKSNQDYNGISIEHIMPQDTTKWEENGIGISSSDHEHYCGSLGNLTILESELNSEISNNIFKIKRNALIEKDVFKINKYFNNIEEWNIKEILKRTSFLIRDYVSEVYNFSHLYEELGKNYDDINIDINQIVYTGEYLKILNEESLNENKRLSHNKKMKMNELIKNGDSIDFEFIYAQRTHYKKIKNKISENKIIEFIFNYLVNGIAGHTLEEKIFDINARGWITKSLLIDTFKVKPKDKGKMTKEYFYNEYLNQIKHKIGEIVIFTKKL